MPETTAPIDLDSVGALEDAALAVIAELLIDLAETVDEHAPAAGPQKALITQSEVTTCN